MSRSSMPLCFFLAALAPGLLAGCDDSHEGPGAPADAALADASVSLADGAPDAAVCQDDPSPTRKLDLLFVIDNSGSMGEEQSSLTANFPLLLDRLQNLPGGLPDLHVGVISSNMGVGGNLITSCAGVGDDGRLQHVARIKGCTPPDAAFIADEIAADGTTRMPNYQGTMADTFTCIAKLGTGGCGFEQHLASLDRALDPTNLANSGFLRPDAYLAVIILADEDDCSARDAAIYSQDETSPVLGPLRSFRCTEFGVTCNEGSPSHTTIGSYTGCRPRTDSPYLFDPKHYVDALKHLKCDPNKIIVAGIIGNATPVNVHRDEAGRFTLDPACQSTANGTADPGVRLDWFVKQFPASTVTSICNDDLAAPLQQIADKLASSIGQ
jgi:hypothetical protein